RDWSSDVCSSDLFVLGTPGPAGVVVVAGPVEPFGLTGSRRLIVPAQIPHIPIGGDPLGHDARSQRITAQLPVGATGLVVPDDQVGVDDGGALQLGSIGVELQIHPSDVGAGGGGARAQPSGRGVVAVRVVLADPGVGGRSAAEPLGG